jgi:hypothetical protein
MVVPQADYFNDYEQELIEADEMKMVMEASLNEYIADIEKTLPVEPVEGSDCLHIDFKADGQIFKRNFMATDKISVKYCLL